MNNVSANANSTTTASIQSAQTASFCFCIKADAMRQRPSVDLQLSDLTKTVNV
jgi:hypothetical protein